MTEQPEEKSLKRQAEEIMTSVDRELENIETTAPASKDLTNATIEAVMKKVFGVISEVDIEAAEKRVAVLRQQHPSDDPVALAQRLIRDKCQRTGTVGAVTSGAGLVPGLGTAAAVSLGVAADIGATFKLQAELVLEIAAVYDHPLTEDEKQRIVLLITGISAGTTTLTRKAGQNIAVKIGERLAARSAEKAFVKALPVVGVIASAGTNVLSTYIIGQRADAYFRLGPEAMGSWSDSLRAISGVDERQIGGWLAEGGKSAGAALAAGAGRVGEAGKAAGGAIVSGTGQAATTVGTAVSSGSQKAFDVSQRGLKAYFRWVVAFWTAVFRGIGRGLVFLWGVIMFVPRKVAGWFGGQAETSGEGDAAGR